MDRLNERDYVAGLGLVLVAVGLFFVWWPLTLIVTGAVLLIVAILLWPTQEPK